MANKLNLIGQKFNQLTIIKFSYMGKFGNSYWLCKCKCGNEKIIAGSKIKSGWTKSCGCLIKKSLIQRLTKHNMSHTKFYKTWVGMNTRCFNKNNISYKDYGGRGITVCERWRKFENFYNDMYLSYKEHLKKYDKKQTTIDRINNEKGYSDNNCRWATYKQQSNNTRHNRILTYNNLTLNLRQWAKKLNIDESTLYGRIREGWNIEKIFNTPIGSYKKNNHFLTYKNKTLTIAQWAEKLNINQNTFYSRMNDDWSIEKIINTPVRFYKKNNQ